jgi:hypothetical protein
MVKNFIVRQADELKAAGATVLQKAFSFELITRTLDGLSNLGTQYIFWANLGTQYTFSFI